ncbi:MAG: hypothetical protein K0B01_12605, partial [Syntrophobacterales bacterium]|nr:hypothetical protein [Syntrophobacterales bacterium]
RGTKRRKWKKNIYKFISKEEDSVTSHTMFVPPALIQFQVAAGKAGDRRYSNRDRGFKHHLYWPLFPVFHVQRQGDLQ